jgi:hypothetical protein
MAPVRAVTEKLPLLVRLIVLPPQVITAITTAIVMAPKLLQAALVNVPAARGIAPPTLITIILVLTLAVGANALVVVLTTTVGAQLVVWIQQLLVAKLVAIGNTTQPLIYVNALELFVAMLMLVPLARPLAAAVKPLGVVTITMAVQPVVRVPAPQAVVAVITTRQAVPP